MNTDPLITGAVVAAVLFPVFFVAHVVWVAWKNRPTPRHRKEQ